ncbi:MAG: dehydrogenase E1 component subunit alpha/beta [Chloroherpetonaceae bacterium]|nr:dehydrogenase E1 component subunit alpha/beta [Chloroherpetonaceae bacterium]
MAFAELQEERKKTAKSKSGGKTNRNLLKRFSKNELLDIYILMNQGRRVDEKLLIMLKQGKASFHIGVSGHEAVQIAVGKHLKGGYDWSYPYYRDLAFCMALGFTLEEVMLDFLAKAEAPSTAGRQMYAHWGHKDLRIVSQSSPTGTQYLQAVGTAIACKRENMKFGRDEVVYVSSGEGTTSQGDFHEALNWASRDKLPVLFLIQDNGYAISVPIEEQTAGNSVYKLTSGYEGLTRFDLNGNDFFESYDVAKEAVGLLRSGKGPVLINAKVVRLLPHSSSDDHNKYRDAIELEEDKKNDCLHIYEKALVDEKIISKEELFEIKNSTKVKIDDAADWADKRPDPTVETITNHIFSEKAFGFEYELNSNVGQPIVMVDAINRALEEELDYNPKMLVYGEDVAGGKGGVFTATRGLTTKFGKERVFNSQLAESSIVGTAIGLAIAGYKPVVEIQFGDYIFPAMMQIRNELGYMRYRSYGAWSCPVVIRVAVGGYIHGAHYHSQNIESIFAHCPGIKIVFPSTAQDAKGLLKTACRSDDPILFLEHKYLYRQNFSKSPEPSADYFVEIGKARVAKVGNDATVITYGALVQRALEAARRIENELGFSIEVIDLRSIIPYDKDAILKSVNKTSKVLVAHEDNLTQGFGAEIAAFISENAFTSLDAPVMRIGALDTPVPYHPDQEEAVLPNDKLIYETLKRLVQY